jgi:Ribbon-helix-helix protein, copG family
MTKQACLYKNLSRGSASVITIDDMKKRKEDADMIQVRIPAKQKRLLEEAARKMGLSLSAWIRLFALKAEREQRAGGK